MAMTYYSSYHPPTCNNVMVCSISLNMSDRIRLIGVPAQVAPYIKDAISRGWGPIQEERDYYGTHEFKLRGNPWVGHAQEAVMSRRVIAYILTAMARNGWNLLQSSDVSKQPGDNDTLFFENGIPDPEVQIFSISFNMSDRIRVIDAPSIMPYVKQAVQTQWRNGIQQECEYFGALELKLAGNPWLSIGGESISSRLLMSQIVANLRAIGFKLYGSIDLSIRSGHGSSGIGTTGVGVGGGAQDLESWFMRKVGPAWQ